MSLLDRSPVTVTGTGYAELASTSSSRRMASFFIPVLLLYLQQQVSGSMMGGALIDGLLGVLFAISYLRTAKDPRW